jgi:ribose 1,5-bisphosphokinase
MMGHLFLIVGPSGAGKDSLLDLAKVHFAMNPNIIFPQRYITRSGDAGGEDHIEVDEEEFEQLKQTGQFAFSWGAHDLKYAIPLSINTALEKGCNVVVNVSRGVIEYVRENYDHVSVISIVVNQDELSRRLTQRGRENTFEIINRLDRAKKFSVHGNDVIEIDNSGDIEVATEMLIKTIDPMKKAKDRLQAS